MAAFAIYGVALTTSTLIALVMATGYLEHGAQEATAISFLTIVLAQLWHVFNIRSRRSGLWRNAVEQNRLVWYALVLCLALILAAVHVPTLKTALQIAPIGAEGWAFAIGCSLMPLIGGQGLAGTFRWWYSREAFHFSRIAWETINVSG